MTSTDTIVGIHLDLKYQMPKKAYLQEWLKRLADWGVNTLLVEYEDKYPFESYPFIRHQEAFTQAELDEFLGTARELGLLTIPLIQTFSHLEFALAHEELAHLREQDDVLTHVCPSKPEAVDFVHALIADILRAHGDDPYVHLAGDEAWFQGKCPTCKAWLEAVGKEAMWGEHEMKFVNQVLASGKRPILWDDLFWGDPAKIDRTGLPKSVILDCWNYARREYKEGTFKQVEAYHANGYETLATPCYDWGVLVPQRTHCLGNTRAWAEKIKREGMRGMINSGWACFHVPLPAKSMFIAATAAMCRGETVDEAWEDAFCEAEYGLSVPGFSEAMEAVGRLWEEKVTEGLGRPITPHTWGVMDMVLAWPDANHGRERNGAYPLDWRSVDYTGIYAKKVELIKGSDRRSEVTEKAREMAAGYAMASRVLGELAAGATSHQYEAETLSLLADAKELYTRVLLHHLTGDGQAGALRAEMDALKVRLTEAMAQCWEPEGAERMVIMWHTPVEASL